MKRLNVAMLVLAALFFSFAACNGNGGEDEDTEIDTPHDPVQDDGIIDVPAEDVPTDPIQDEPAVDPTDDDTVTPDVPVDMPEEEVGPGACGNGIEEDGEACDDGNTLTEFCGGEGGCLSDCSMSTGACGNGSVDMGEDCDGGADCTTSCKTNDYNIGAPCVCEGSDCTETNFSAGTIIGCDNVTVPPGSGGVLACLFSAHNDTASYDTFFAGGSCTIMAMRCEGNPLICALVTEFGDMDTFACPSGYYEHEDSRDIFGITIISKTCLKICTSPSECRWNEWDTFHDECGQWDCVPTDPANPSSVHVCSDLRDVG